MANINNLGEETPISSWGDTAATRYYGQTFVATGSTITKIQFKLDQDLSPLQSTDFNVILVSWNSTESKPTAILWTSDIITVKGDEDRTHDLISIDVPNIPVDNNVQYAFFLNANAGIIQQYSDGAAYGSVAANDDYSLGDFYFNHSEEVSPVGITMDRFAIDMAFAIEFGERLETPATFNTVNITPTELQVNVNTAGNQNAATITALSNGGFVVAWNTGDGRIAFRTFEANGANPSTEKVFGIGNSFGNYAPSGSPSVVALPNGAFAIAYEEDIDSSAENLFYDVKLQKFDSAGEAVGLAIRIGSGSGQQTNPTLTYIGPDDTVFVAFDDRGDGEHIVGHVVNFTGYDSGGFVMPQDGPLTFSAPSAVGLNRGFNFAVASSSDGVIWVSTFVGSIRADFAIAIPAAEGQTLSNPSIALLPNGRLVVAWTESTSGRPDKVAYKLLDRTGENVTEVMYVEATSGQSLHAPSVTAYNTAIEADDGFVISFTDATGGPATAAYVQRFNSTGAAISNAALLGDEAPRTYGDGYHFSVRSDRYVAQLTDGKVAAIYEGSGPSDQTGIYVRVYDYAPAATAPDLISLDITTPAGAYNEGDLIIVEATFDTAVTVTGAPTVDIVVGGTTKTAALSSGSDTTKLTFTYTVAAGDTDMDGVTIPATAALKLNGGTIIKDGGTLPAEIATYTVGGNAAVVDTTAPEAPTLALQTDTGSSNSDGITNNVRVNVSGLELDAKWAFSLNGGTDWTEVGPATASMGSFMLNPGVNNVQVRQTDTAGNVGLSASKAFTLDTTAPTASSTPSPTVGGEDTGYFLIPKTLGDDFGVHGYLTGGFDLGSNPSNGALYYLRGGNYVALGTNVSQSAAGDDLYYKPNTNFSGNDSFKIRVLDNAGNTSDLKINVTVDPTSDIPNFSASAPTTGAEDTAIPLVITASPTDTTGTPETVTVEISGIPNNAVLKNATTTFTVSGGKATVPADALSGLTLTPPTDFDGQITLSVKAISQDGAAAPVETAAQPLIINVTKVNDGDTTVTGPAATSPSTPKVGVPLSSTLGTFADADGLGNTAPVITWQISANGIDGWTDTRLRGADAIPTANEAGKYIRASVEVTDNQGFKTTLNGDVSQNPVEAADGQTAFVDVGAISTPVVIRAEYSTGDWNIDISEVVTTFVNLIITGLGAELVKLSPVIDVVQTGANNDIGVLGNAGGDDVVDLGTGTDTVTFPSVAATETVLVDLRDRDRSDTGDNQLTTSLIATLGTVPIATNTPMGIAIVRDAGGALISTDALISVENATGGSGNDTFIGADGVANILDGGAGGIDTADYSHITAAGGGITVNLGAGTVTGGDTGGDTLISIENVVGTQGGDFITGGAGNNALTGSGGIDTAIYSGVRSAYTITTNGAGGWTVTNVASGEGTDTLATIERLQFADSTALLVGNGGYPDINAAIAASAPGNVIINATNPSVPFTVLADGPDYTEQQQLPAQPVLSNTPHHLFSDANLGSIGVTNLALRLITITATDFRPGDDLRVAASTTTASGATVTVNNAQIFVQVPSLGDLAPVFIGTVADQDTPGSTALSFFITGGLDSDVRVNELLKAVQFLSTSDDPTGNLSNANDIARSFTMTVTQQGNTNIASAFIRSIDVIPVNDLITSPTTNVLYTPITEDISGLPSFNRTGTIVFDDVDFLDTVTADPEFQASAITSDLVIRDGAGLDVTSSYTPAVKAALLAELSFSGLTLNRNNDAVEGDGQLTWNLDIEQSALNFLPAGVARTLEFAITVDGGGGATDKVTKTISVTVTGANDAPTGANALILMDEAVSLSRTLTTADFGFSDLDAGDTLSAVRIDTLPLATDGVLKLNGVAVVAGDVVLATAITAGNLVFTAVDKTASATTASFTFSVRDSSGVGESEFAAAPNTITFNVTNINDAPVVTAVTGPTYNDTANDDTFTGVAGTLVATDADAGATLTYGVLGGIVSAGVSTLVGVNGTLAVNTSTGAYTFTPTDAAIEAKKSTVSETFQFTVSDTATTTQSPFTVTINGVNDTPVITTAGPIARTMDEDGAAITGTITATDRDGDVLSYTVSTAPANGVANVGLLTGGYTYTPTTNFSGQNSFAVQASDGAASSTITITVDVAPKAETPVLTLNGVAGSPTPAVTKLAAAKIAVFDNAAYVDTTSAIPGAEAENIRATLTGQGHDVSLFTGITAADFTAALAGNTVLVIPNLEVGDLAAALLPDAISAIQAFVNAGGSVLVGGESGTRDTAFLNTVFGFGVAEGTSNPAGPYNRTSAAAGTQFADDANTLSFNAGTYPLGITGLPATAQSIYSVGSNSVVTAFSYGGGQVVHLAWDWFNAVPNGTLNGGWLQVLDSAISKASVVVTAAEDSGALSLGTLMATTTDNVDGSESVSLLITGFVAGTTFSAGGTPIGSLVTTGPDAGKWLINAADTLTLATTPLSITPPLNYNGTMQLEVTAVSTDRALLSTGAATDVATSVAKTYTVTFTPVNDAPVLTVPVTSPGAPLAATEDVQKAITGISFTDVDVNEPPAPNDVTATLFVTNGTLSVTASGAVVAGGNGTTAANAMTITGTMAQVNAALATVQYLGLPNYTGTDTLSVTINDLGNTGATAPLSDTKTVTINVAPVDDAPIFATPVPLRVQEGTGVVLNAAGTAAGTNVVVDVDATDPDAGSVVTYSLVDDAGGRFVIDATTGEVRLSTDYALSFDWEQNTFHTITVRATGTQTASSFSEQAIVINVVNVTSEALTLTAFGRTVKGGTSNDSFIYNQGGATGTYVLDGTHPDGADNDTVTINLTAGLDTPIFTVAGGFFSANLDSDADAELNVQDIENVIINGLATGDTITISGDLASVGVTSLTVNGGDDTAGGDTIDVSAVTNLGATINGGTGADTVKGSNQADTINGGDGADVIRGLGGADSINGGNDADTIIVELEADYTAGDTVDGGAGNDTLALSTGTVLDLGVDGRVSSVETIELSGTTGVDASVQLEGFRILETATTGINDIKGGQGADNITSGAGNDIVDGGLGADTIDGGADDDNLSGGDGADTIIGGYGKDAIAGGTGADVIYGDDTAGNDSLGDIDTITDGDGVARVVAGAGNDSVTVTYASGFTGLTGPAHILGNAGDDTIDLTFSGQDLSAVNIAGDDDATRDLATDTGGATDGKDSVTLNGAWTGALHVSLNGGDDTFTNRGTGSAQVNAGTGNDDLVGGMAAETLVGGGGNDKITGNGGADDVRGGAGDDIITWKGGDGADTIVGGEAGETDGDLLKLEATTGADVISIAGETLTYAGGTGSVTEIEDFDINMLGGADSVTIGGLASGQLVTADGGADTDTLTVNLTTGMDVANLADNAATGGVDVFIGTPVAIASKNFEKIVINAGADADSVGAADVGPTTVLEINGGAGADNLTAGAGNDTINGGTDNDIITGNAGNDSIDGGSEDDRITGGAGNDVIEGGVGTDTSAYAGARADYTITMASDASGFVTGFSSVKDNVTTTLDEGTDTLTSIEALDFNGVVLDLRHNVQVFRDIDTNSAGLELVGTYATLQEAVDAGGTTNGDTVRVRSGATLTEDVEVSKSLTIEGANKGIDPISGVRVSESTLAGTFTVTAANVTIDGFVIDPAGNGKAAITATNVAGLKVLNNEIDHTASADTGRAGINLNNVTNATIDGNDIDLGLTAASLSSAADIAAAPYAIQISGGGTGVTITDNAINGAVRGVSTTSEANLTTVSITDNTFTDVGAGVMLQGNDPAVAQPGITDGVTIQRNTFGDLGAGLDRAVVVLDLPGAAEVRNLVVGDVAGATDDNTYFASSGKPTSIVTVTGAGAPAVTLGGSNKIDGSASNDILVGGSGADTILGNSGNDYVRGNGGIDVIDAGGGDDTIIYVSGDGTEALAGGAETDTLNIFATNPNDTVKLGVGTVALGGGTLTYAGIETMVIDAKAEVTPDDATGTADVLDFTGLTSGVTVDLSNQLNQTVTGGGLFSVGGLATITAKDFEDVIGTAQADVITGSAEANVITGAGGADDLKGLAGTDTFMIGSGDYVAGDKIDGGTEADKIIFTGTDMLTLSPTDADVVSVESIELSAGGNLDAGGLAASGSGQTDGFTITDTTIAGAADSSNDVVGSKGKDTILLGLGDDTVNAGLGDDTITGGVGNDSIKGGEGIDTAVYSGNWNEYDVVLDPSTLEYRIRDRVLTNGDEGTDRVLIFGDQKVEKFLFNGVELTAFDVLNRAPEIDQAAGQAAITTLIDENAPGANPGAWSFNANSYFSDENGKAGIRDTHVFSLTNDAGGRFQINAATGVVTVANGALFDFETNAAHTFAVKVEDAGRLFDVETFSVTVKDLNEAPIVTSLPQVGRVVEDGGALETTARGMLTVVDRDAGSSFTLEYFDGTNYIPVGVSPVTVTNNYGTFTLNSAGAWTFDLDNTKSATDQLGAEGNLQAQVSLVVRAKDNLGLTTADQSLLVTIDGTNDAPRISSTVTTSAIQEDGSTLIQVLGGSTPKWSDAEGKALTIISAAGVNGTVQILGDTLVYAPNKDWHGTETITYTVSDGQRTTSSTISVVVNPINDAPVAVDAYLGTTTEDATITGNVALTSLATDVDTAPASLTFAPVGVTIDGVPVAPANLSPTWLNFDLATGAYSVNPAAAPKSLGFQEMNPTESKTIAITYQVSDGAGGTDIGVISFDITGANDAPTIGTIANLTLGENTDVGTQVATVTTGDIDNGATRVLTIVSGNNDGLFAIDQSTGVITLTRKLDDAEVGTRSIAVQATDNGGLSVSTSFSLTVTNVDDDPTATSGPIALAATEDDAFSFTMPAGTFRDADGDVLTYSLVSAPLWMTIDPATGAISGTPDNSHVTTSALSFTVEARDAAGVPAVKSFSVTVANTNDAPVAGNDTATASEDILKTNINVLSNDTDVDVGDTRTVVSAEAEHGVVTMNTDGTLNYLGNKDFNGSDTISYTIRDAAGALAVGTVAVTVGAINDAPVAVDVLVGTTTEDARIDGNIPLANLASDVDNTLTGANFSLVSVAINGTPITNPALLVGGWVDFDTSNGNYTFNPAMAPAALGFQELNVNDSKTITITYRVSDGQLFDTGDISFAVTGVNDAPIIGSVTLATAPDQNATVGTDVATVTATDVDNATLTYAITGGNDEGLFKINSSGLIEIAKVPGQANVGNHQLTVEVSDGKGATAAVGVTASITDLNDLPTAIIVTDALTVIAENTAARTKIATFAVADIDTAAAFLNNTVTVSDTARFEIVGNELFLKAGQTIDREAPEASITLTLTTGSGPGAVTKSVTLDIADVNDKAPVLTLTSPTTSVEENNAETDVATLTIADADVTLAVNGTVVYTLSGADAGRFEINAGKLVFKAGADFEASSADGDDTYSVTVTAADGSDASLTTSANLSVAVTNANEAPTDIVFTQGATVTNNVITIAENTANSTVVATAAGVDADVPTTFTYSLAAGSPFAIDSVSGAISVADTTALNFEDGTNFTLQVTASDGMLSSMETLTINLSDVNEAPVATPVGASGDEDSVIAVTLTGVDPDNGDAIVSFTLSGVPSNGKLYTTSGLATEAFAGGTYMGVGSVTLWFKPDADFNGSVSFNYLVSDGDLASATAATATIVVNPVNDAPTGAPTATLVSGTEDAAYTVTSADLLAGFSDPEGNTLSVIDLVASDGVVTQLPNGDFQVIPEEDFNGVMTLTYSVTDGDGILRGQTRTYAVNAVNDAPTDITLSKLSVAENAAGGVVGAINAADVDSSRFSYTVSDDRFEVAGGNLKLRDGVSLDHEGEPTVALTVTVNDNPDSPGGATYTEAFVIGVTDVNETPVAVDLGATGDEDSLIAVTLSGADPDAADGASVFKVATLPANGILYSDAAGTVAVTTEATYGGNGAVTLYFRPTANSNAPASFTYTAGDGVLTSAPATVSITVNAVNDAPVVLSTITGPTIAEDSAVNFQLPAGVFGDVDNATLALTASGQPSWLVFDAATQTFTGTPPANFNGGVPVTVTATDAAGATVSTAFSITVTAVNDLPVANTAAPANTASGLEDTVINGAVPLGSDVETSEGALTYSLVSGPASGSLAFNPDGSFAYTPAANANGPVTFSYRVVDGSGAVSTSQAFTINVTAVNDAPVATAGIGVTGTEESAIISGNLSATDVETAAASLTFSLVGAAPAGLTLLPNGSFTFVPSAADQGLDTGESRVSTFQYRASDGTAFSAPTSVSVTINGVNDAPTVVADALSGIEDNQLVFNVNALLGNDSDIDGELLQITSVSNPVGGTVSILNGNIIFTPNLNFDGNATFTYTVSDGTDQASATASIAFAPVNDDPTAVGVTGLTSLAENTTTATVIGDVVVSDPDTQAAFRNNPVTVSDSRFEVVNDQLRLKAGQAVDFETTPTISLTLSTGGVSQVVAVTVTNVNETPAVGGLTGQINPPVGTIAGTGLVVGRFTATDPDGDALGFTTNDNRFTVRSEGNGNFALVAAPGAVFTAFEGDVAVQVTASDGSIAVQQAFQLGTAVGGTNNLAISEEATVGTLVGTVSAPAGITGASYSLNGAGQPFTVDAAGNVRVNGSLDFEATPTYSLNLNVTSDQGALTQTVGLSITDVQTLANGTAGGDTMTGTDGEDTRLGLGGNDSISTGARDDIASGGANDDTIDGGAGRDNLSGGDGNDQILGGEYLSATANQAMIYRLYETAFNRLPDTGGFNAWTQLADNGATLSQLAFGFVMSDEFNQTYGNLSNADYVERLYVNTLDRASDVAGKTGWVNALNNGASRMEVMIGFSESEELKIKTIFATETFLTANGNLANTSASSDIISGGAGNDTMFGGLGADRFVFDIADKGTDRVWGFGADDSLQFTGFGYSGIDDVKAHMTQFGRDVVFTDQGVTFTLQDYQLTALNNGNWFA